MKRFFLIRHAQSESNAGIIINQNHLINLTELGIKQAESLSTKLIKMLPNPQAVFVSPYIRTAQTAKPYLTKLGRESQLIDALQEFNMLDFQRIERKCLAEIRVMADEFWATDNAHRDSDQTDSFDEFVTRVKTARQAFAQMDDGDYVVFTHGMWIGMLIWQLLHADGQKVHDKRAFAVYELAVRPNNCDVYLLTISDNGEQIGKLHSDDNDKSMII